MIDSLLNLVFRCAHRRLTRPVTPVSRAGKASGETYVVCLDCGKQFGYDVKNMRMGKAIDRSHDDGVLPPNLPGAKKTKLKYALWASLPLAALVGTVLKSDKSRRPKAPAQKAPAAEGDRPRFK